MKNFFLRLLAVKTPEQAVEIKKRLAMVYAFIGWNSCLVVIYLLWKKNIPEDPSEKRIKLGRLDKEGTTHVIRMQGLHLLEHYKVENAKATNDTDNQVDKNKVETVK